jgi:hypothetical protein
MLIDVIPRRVFLHTAIKAVGGADFVSPSSTTIMRPTILLVSVLAATSAHASWFGTDKPGRFGLDRATEQILRSRADYSTWDEAQLKAWLQSHNIEPPETYNSVQLQVRSPSFFKHRSFFLPRSFSIGSGEEQLGQGERLDRRPVCPCSECICQREGAFPDVIA